MKSSPLTEKSKNTEKQAEDPMDEKSRSNDDSGPSQKRQKRMKVFLNLWCSRFIRLLTIAGIGIVFMYFITSAFFYIMDNTPIASDSTKRLDITGIQQKNTESRNEINRMRADINALRREIKENTAKEKNTESGNEINRMRADINALRREIKENTAKEKNTESGNEINRMRADINALQREIKENTAKEKNASTPGKDAILIIAVNGIDRAIQNGDSYASELELLASMAPDAQGIDQLRSYAYSEIKTREQLRVSFTDMAFDIIAAANKTKKAAKTIIGRIFNKLFIDIIRIRPRKYQGGKRVEDIVAHMEEYMKNNDLVSAVTEAKKLNSPHIQDVMQSWIVEAELRLKVERLLSNLRHAVLSKLDEPTVTQTK